MCVHLQFIVVATVDKVLLLLTGNGVFKSAFLVRWCEHSVLERAMRVADLITFGAFLRFHRISSVLSILRSNHIRLRCRREKLVGVSTFDSLIKPLLGLPLPKLLIRRLLSEPPLRIVAFEDLLRFLGRLESFEFFGESSVLDLHLLCLFA